MGGRAALVALFACAALVGCAPRRLAAQTAPAELTQYHHDAWRSEDGLPGNSILAMRQSPDGYLWLTTLSGLARFDGVRFTVFDRTNTPALRDATFPTLPLLVDRRGAMWIGTRGGLVRYADGAFRRDSIRGGWPLSVVTLMEEDEAGTFWMVEGRLEGSPVYVLRGGRVARASTKPQLPDDAIIVRARTRGGIWVGTASHGLIRVVDGVATTMVAAGALPQARITNIFEGRDGTVWIGTPSGFARLSGEVLTSYPFGQGRGDGYVTALAEDRDGSVWVGTTGLGLLRWRDGHIARYPAADVRSRAGVLALCVDREGSVWVGTQRGLERLRVAAFATLSTFDGGPTDRPGALLWDGAGELWIAHSAAGLYRGVPGRLRRVTAGGVSSAKVRSLARGRDGRVWVGRDRGLTLFHRGGTRTFGVRDGLEGEMVIALHEDRRGRLWAGTDAGLFRLEGGRFTAFTPAQGLASRFVLSIAEDSSGAVWVGTNGGLSRVSPRRDTIASFRVTDGLPNPIVAALHATGDGAVWAATLGGLARIKGGRLASVRAEHGLPDDFVIALSEDRDGNLWLATAKGVARVPLSELNAVADGRATRARATTFDTRDGLRTVEVVAAAANPVLTKGPDGRLWFSTTAGVAVVDPGALPHNSAAPHAVVEETVVDGRPLPPGATREIPADAARLDIRYTATSLRVPERVRFRYMLEGFDTRWSDATDRRDVSYTNLPPGSYTFRLVAANDDGVWNRDGAAVAFRALPAFHETWYFYALCGVAVVVVGASVARAYYGLRERRARAALEAHYAGVVDERTRIAQDLHDTLLQGFAGVTLQLKTAELALPERPDVAAETIMRVQGLARESLREARARVWDMREPDVGSDLPDALEAVARERAAGTGIEVDVACTGERRRLARSVEDAAFRIAREAVVNAIRHAGARRVEVRVDFRATSLRVEVRDDGRGFAPAEAEAARRNGHFGLSGARERARHFGGTCEVITRPGGGTTVAVELPLAGPGARKDTPNGVLPRPRERADLPA
jgi:signal transduction histidine kinase/ligand-binding sensor domain-containing protein